MKKDLLNERLISDQFDRFADRGVFSRTDRYIFKTTSFIPALISFEVQNSDHIWLIVL